VRTIDHGQQLVNLSLAAAHFFVIYKAGTGRHDIAESGVKHTKDQSGIVISFMLY
jgi:hypothetical protein